MSDKKKDKELIDELENYEYSMRDDGDEEFAKILKQAQERLKHLIQQKPEIDGEKMATEIHDKLHDPNILIGAKLKWLREYIDKIVSDVKGGKHEKPKG